MSESENEACISILSQIYGLIQEGRYDDAQDVCRCAAEWHTQDIEDAKAKEDKTDG